ncbi:MAG: hypothetical protein KDK39_15620, partial [Leptospiraceae bacterium]|nr:hypothetical protein [Leptospiraceae bacterium]
KVKLGVYSNYISKGKDVFSDRAIQKKKAYGANTGAPLFRPEVTVNLPEPGLFFKFEGYMALAGRADQDLDGFIQKGPAGSNLLYGKASLDDQIQALKDASGLFDSSTGQFNALNTLLSDSMVYPNCKTTGHCLPKLYKEEVGLWRKEEYKFYVGYGRKTNVGNIRVQLKYIEPLSNNAERSSKPSILIDYSLPNLAQLQFQNETSLDSNWHYFVVKWADKQSLTQLSGSDLYLTYWAAVGYRLADHLAGVQDVPARIGLAWNGFSLGAGAVWRPDLRFFDTDKTATGDNRIPVWLLGKSTIGDGEVADPSRKYGYYNEILNRSLQNYFQTGPAGSLYTYTPRQSLPRYLVWVDLAYTFDLY